MRTTLSLIAVTLATGSAFAEPVIRFGLTSGADRNTPEGTQMGPNFAAGVRSGVFTGEANYAYLSFFDPETRIHRAGVALRMTVASWIVNANNGYSKAIYLEAGAGKRWGQWRLDPMTDAFATTQNEAHVGVGYELGRSWQLALRLGASRRHEQLDGVACRGSVSCGMFIMPDSSPIAESVMLEWMFVFPAPDMRGR